MIMLSIIIVTYKPGEIFRSCLENLSNAINVHFELIVVDNHSQDDSLAVAEEYFPDAQIIANLDNRGFAAANNQGLAIAIGKYCLLLNPDVVLHENALRNLIAFMEINSDVGIAGPRTLEASGIAALSAHTPLSVVSILWRWLAIDYVFPNIVYGRYRKACQYATEPIHVGWVSGSCFLIRKEVYEQIGGLDEGLFLYVEEPDYCDRAINAGWRVSYVPSAQVTHYESTSISKYPLVKIRSYHISPLYYFRKRHQQRAVLALKLGFSIELLLKAAVRLIQGVIKRDKVAMNAAHARLKVLLEVLRY